MRYHVLRCYKLLALFSDTDIPIDKILRSYFSLQLLCQFIRFFNFIQLTISVFVSYYQALHRIFNTNFSLWIRLESSKECIVHGNLPNFFLLLLPVLLRKDSCWGFNRPLMLYGNLRFSNEHIGCLALDLWFFFYCATEWLSRFRFRFFLFRQKRPHTVFLGRDQHILAECVQVVHPLLSVRPHLLQHRLHILMSHNDYRIGASINEPRLKQRFEVV